MHLPISSWTTFQSTGSWFELWFDDDVGDDDDDGDDDDGDDDYDDDDNGDGDDDDDVDDAPCPFPNSIHPTYVDLQLDRPKEFEVTNIWPLS